MSASAVDVVAAWHEAVNAADVERLLALSSEEVEVGGPRGSGRGAAVLREWVARARIHLEPRRVFWRGETVVVQEAARWPGAETGELTPAQEVASVFDVRDGRVVRVVRHADLGAALKAAGLDESHEVLTT
ncbi:MAG TPA: nuclear transport factor 2 family protein [Chloroflexota bacterium]|nr:nuclear transport factor 2 family protein [Chloroflexota bacterium]